MLTLVLALLLCFVSALGQEDINRKNYVASLENKLELLEKDSQLILNLDAYADKLQEKMDQVNWLTVMLSKSLLAAESNKEEYLSNPLNSFSLIRHMQADWAMLEEFMRRPVGKEQIDYVRQMRAELPVNNDVVEAIHGFYRIQEIYGLEPAHMARGLLHGVQYNASLSSIDCYALGFYCYENADYWNAEQWVALAIKLMQRSQRQQYEALGLRQSDMSRLHQYTLHAQDDEWSSQHHRTPEDFMLACRGVVKSRNTRLQCRYNTTTVPFSRLAPFKMEQLSVNPYVVVYHDVLSAAETAEIARISTPLFKRTVLYSAKYKKEVTSLSRSADGVWLPQDNHTEQESAFLARIRQRVIDLAGLSFREKLQVLNYGFGGHYLPHYDYFNQSSPYTKHVGDRIATVLFYLNDVPQGGATAFPYLQLAVRPERGKVLHWYNMDGDTYDFDTSTLHGACPVIVGHKMGMTSWIHEREQVFIKPSRSAPRSRSFETETAETENNRNTLFETQTLYIQNINEFIQKNTS